MSATFPALKLHHSKTAPFAHQTHHSEDLFSQSTAHCSDTKLESTFYDYIQYTYTMFNNYAILILRLSYIMTEIQLSIAEVEYSLL